VQTLRARVEKRRERADDASDAGLDVLEAQRLSAEPLAPDEQAAVFVCSATTSSNESQPCADWGPLLKRLASPQANAH
jgi:predicted kinase